MKQLITAILLSFAAAAAAQPVNDDCPGVIDLGVAPACPQQFFSNVNATASDIGFGNNPTCFNGGLAPRDVWFSFTTNDTIFDYSITVTGGTNAGIPPMRNPQIALYRGECMFDGLAELLCASAPNGETILRMDVYGLTPNVTYFIRISDYSPTATPNWGTFQLCVEQLSPIFTIDEGGSSACFGQLFDSGGPDGDYSNNETHTFTICPTDFHQCITFTLDYYNIEGSDFQSPDQISFFDAATPDPSALISSIGGAGFPSDGGGGGVCYMVQASSGCLTVQFRSDATVTQEGFAGRWECSTVPCEDQDPITVQGSITQQDILNSITSLQTLVTITDINCPTPAYGIFQATDDAELGLERGLLLTTGSLNWAVGPNNNGGGGNIIEANNNAPGDPDLDYLSVTFGDGTESNDACIIELDITAFTNEITFEYIFASEEYPEFVNDFNDIFAFLISGPGITGDPNIGNQLNIAVLPDGSNTLVEINNINNLTNWQYYRNNENGRATQYDGLTSDFLGVKKSLTARASVIPCSTYHLKIAIADRLDFVYDSGVFISEIRGGTPRLAVEFNSGIDYLIENCTNTPDNVVINLSNVLDEPASYRVVVGGTATPGVDYTLNIPDTIVFQPGQTQLSFPITPLNDNLMEDTETITIALTNDFGCGEVVYTTLTIELRDELAIQIIPDADTAFVCQGASVQLGVQDAATYFWTPVNIMNDPLSPTPLATPTTDTWVTVQANVGICSAVDSVFLKVVPADVDIQQPDTLEICLGATVPLVAVTSSGSPQGLLWSATLGAGLSDTIGLNVTGTPIQTAVYRARFEVGACVVFDSVYVRVDSLPASLITAEPQKDPYCPGETVVLTSPIFEPSNFPDISFQWLPGPGYETADTLWNMVLTTIDTATYRRVILNRGCVDTAFITLNVVEPPDITLTPSDTTICPGESVQLIASGYEDYPFRWEPTTGLSCTDCPNPVATPAETITYTFIAEVPNCPIGASSTIRVVPPPVTGPAGSQTICLGTAVQLNTGFDNESTYTWTANNDPNFSSNDPLLVVVPLTTTTYTLTANKAGCPPVVINITLTVVIPPTVSAGPDQTICEGSVAALAGTVGGSATGGSWSVSPAGGAFSPNANALDASFTTSAPGVYTLTLRAADPNGVCPVASDEMTLTVNPRAVVNAGSDTTVCAGSAVQLAGSISGGASSAVWTSSVPGGVFNPNANTLNATYTPPAGFTAVTLTLLSNDPAGPCPFASDEMVITIVPPATVDAGPDTFVCRGDPITLSASGSAAAGIPQSYSWSGPGITPPADTNRTLTISNTGGIASPAIYVVTYRYGPNLSCGTVRDTVRINVADPVNIDSLTASMDTVILGGETTLAVFTTPASPTDVMYLWALLGDDTPEMGGPTLTVSPEPEFAPGETLLSVGYVVTVKSPEGCLSSDTIFIWVRKPLIDFPNIFTPNGDDLNDVFLPVPEEAVSALEFLEFKVYNRWGQVVYDGRKNDFQGWDGTHNGKPAPSDVYVYRVRYRYPGEDIQDAQGDVTLIR